MSTDVSNNTSGGARYLYVQVSFNDSHTSTFSDVVTGTLTHSIRTLRPSGIYVNEAAPSGTNTTLLTS